MAVAWDNFLLWRDIIFFTSGIQLKLTLMVFRLNNL